MPKKISLELEGYIRGLCDTGLSQRDIVQHLSKRNVSINQSTISRIKNNVGMEREHRSKGKIYTQRRDRPIRTKSMVAKVRRIVTKENPPKKQQLADKLGLSRRTLSRIIQEDCHLELRSKRNVLTLTDKQMQNRKTNSRKLYRNHLSADKSDFAVTLDEALFYFIPGNQTSKTCFIKRGYQTPEDWVRKVNEIQAPKVMVVAAMTSRGPLQARCVPIKTKVNALYYIDNVLRPIIEKELPTLFPDDMNKIFIHHDKATSHTANQTMAFLKEMKEKYGISYQEKEDIVVKRADVSPMDFFGFGWLKTKVQSRRVKTLQGFCKAIREEWSKLSPDVCKRVYESWKVRCRVVAEQQGKVCEGRKDIHRHRKSLFNCN